MWHWVESICDVCERVYRHRTQQIRFPRRQRLYPIVTCPRCVRNRSGGGTEERPYHVSGEDPPRTPPSDDGG